MCKIKKKMITITKGWTKIVSPLENMKDLYGTFNDTDFQSPIVSESSEKQYRYQKQSHISQNYSTMLLKI